MRVGGGLGQAGQAGRVRCGKCSVDEDLARLHHWPLPIAGDPVLVDLGGVKGALEEAARGVDLLEVLRAFVAAVDVLDHVGCGVAVGQAEGVVPVGAIAADVDVAALADLGRDVEGPEPALLVSELGDGEGEWVADGVGGDVEAVLLVGREVLGPGQFLDDLAVLG